MQPSITTRPGSVSAAGIVIGVFAALTCQLLFDLLGLGIGALAIDHGGDTQTWSGIAWWAVTSIISSFTGGGVAGWMAGAREGSPGFHGLATWAVSTVFVALAASFVATGTALGMLAGPSFLPGLASDRPVGSFALASFIALILGGFAAYYGAQIAAAREARLHPAQHARVSR